MSDDYEVGYKKPPKKSQFKPGQSGNSKGRSKGSKNLKTVVQEEAYSKIPIKEGGKSKTVTKVEALMKSMLAKGIKGDTKAANIALNLMKEFLPHGDPEAAARAPLTEEELQILTNHAEFLEVIKEADNVDPNT